MPPASSQDILPLWPADAADINQYVAMHRTGLEDPEQPVLDAACDLVSSMQSYAMAAHGLRAAPLGRVQHRISESLRQGAIKDKESEKAFRRALDALHAMVTHVEGISWTLAKAYTTTQQKAVALRDEEQKIRQTRRELAEEAHSVRKERHAARQKQKQTARAAEALDQRAAALAEREREVETERANALARMQESIAASKNASVAAVRRATLREEAADQREVEAAQRIRQAEEQAADASSALESIRQRNQRMADQMRELQAAVRRAQEKYRAVRAQSSQHTHAEATYRKRIAELEARSSENDERGSSPTLLAKRPRSSPQSDTTLPHTPGADCDLDDDEFPMPGGILANGPQSPGKKAARVSRPLQESHTFAWNGPLVLGPRRRPG
ncbi:hypothetical protein MOBT1_002698 [Malassezia obtusa]|uniref:Uncharacterized protein n=1 Tax=Malassezia obtusa TaxID=76774 RepID=A0AAF0E252_9BASI|nr:hypothetical protein MOBT1_002698 [Malassezia obtusa]